jgi:hypothetical protein
MNSYINISEQTNGDGIYDFVPGQMVTINGEKRLIDNVSYGDKVEFVYNGRQTSIVVRSINHVQTYGRQTCVLESCIVERLEDTVIQVVTVDELKIGDKVKTPNGFKSITHILQSRASSKIMMSCNLHGLIITHYHPVKKDNKWIFPINDSDYDQWIICDSNEYIYLYSFALENSESMYVNDTEIICLGHGIVNDEVASHPYFGTNKVLEDIIKLDGSGHCVINEHQIHRDPTSNLICKIQ